MIDKPTAPTTESDLRERALDAAYHENQRRRLCRFAEPLSATERLLQLLQHTLGVNRNASDVAGGEGLVPTVTVGGCTFTVMLGGNGWDLSVLLKRLGEVTIWEPITSPAALGALLPEIEEEEGRYAPLPF